MSTQKIVAFLPVTEEMLADGRGFVDRWRADQAALEASEGERYNRVYRRGYQAGAEAAFEALRVYLDRGGRVGVAVSRDSIHIQTPGGMRAEILSLLALRPWAPE
jgi:hypothetical protein